MKKILAICLSLALLLPLFLINNTVEAEKIAVQPFYGGTWTSVDREKFPNLASMPSAYIYIDGNGDPYFLYGGVQSNTHGMGAVANAMMKSMNALPKGLRYLQFLHPRRIYDANAEAIIDLDEGFAAFRDLVSEFIQEFNAVGGLLDGVIMDVEYIDVGNWYVYKDGYAVNSAIYKEIVENEVYQTKIRPRLEERGFKFWPNPSGNKSELWSIYPYSGDAYGESRIIWNAVMNQYLTEGLNFAVYEPVREYYPDAHMSDYQTTASYSWNKELNREGGQSYLGGNSIQAGDTSNLNTYFVQPSQNFYMHGDSYVYKNPYAYNKAVYDNDSFNMFLWDANRFKNMYDSTETGRVNIWISEYDTQLDGFYDQREGSTCNTPYYSELFLHTGLLNPDLYLIYFPREDRPDLTNEEFELRYKVMSECLSELTRVVGAVDRQPISVPANWNEGFVLSGMYAGGRNMWRLTPDTTNGMTLENFKVKDQVPTFYINGKTIIFPQGRIVETGEVSVVGTCGYWIETPADVTPVIIADEDRFENNPSYIENFDRYTAGTAFNADNVKEKDAWEFSDSEATVIANGGNNVLSVTGTTTISNVQLPANITAGDSYAKQQAWEVSFTLPATLSSGSVNLLTCGSDTGFKISGSSLYYDKNGTATQFSGLTLSAGTKYTVRREVNFNNNTCTYLVFANGSQIAKAENIVMKSVTLPVSEISFKTSSLGSKTILLDDYKLYPMGFAADFEVYNANTGIKLSDATAAYDGDVAYRLSWLNATDTAKKATVVAQYYKNGTLQSSVTVGEFTMAPGNDGVETAIVENKEGMTVKLVLQTADTTLTETPDYDNGDFDWPRYEDNVVQPEDSVTAVTPVITMESGRVIAGKEFQVTVSVKNNPGVSCMKLNLSYDRSKLELVSAANGDYMTGFVGSDITAYPYVMSWGNPENPVDATGNGTLVVLTFKALKVGASETDIRIAFSRTNVYNADGQCVELIPVPHTVSIQGNMPGDVNGDGTVNAKDATLLRRYVAKWPDVTIDLTAADVNGDGVVNAKDVTILRRYVAKWPGVELG